MTFSDTELRGLDPEVHLPVQSNFQNYSVDEFCQNYEISNCVASKYFSVLHSNVRSLNANFENLKQLLSDLNHNFTMIGLTETKINTLDNSPSYNIPGYQFYSQPSLSNAGGAGIFISKNLTSSIRDDLSCSVREFESLWIEIESDLHHNLVCGVMYRHPSNDTEAFTEYLNQTIQKLANENKYCVVMGDFNIDLLNSSHRTTVDFLNVLETHFFNPHILQPTRITHHSATLIDNIFFNSITHHTISGNIIHDLSDHLPNFLIINKFSSLPKNFKISRRDYSKFNEEAFLKDIGSIDWTLEFSDEDNSSVMFDRFYSKVSSFVDKHIPLRYLSNREIKNLSKPWITKGLRISIQKKNILYKKFIQSRSQYYHDKFKSYRNKLNHLIKLSKTNYYNQYFSSNRSNIKNTWKGVKEVVGFNAGNTNLPSKIITDDNNELTDCTSIANSFNQFFTKIGRNLAASVPNSNTSPLTFMPPVCNNTFHFTPISRKEIEDQIEQINAKKSTGPFSIPVYILKLIKSQISAPLQLIFNNSLLLGIVPESFKLASITPVFKKGSQLNVNNYRPISLLSTFNKILEKLVYKRLIEFINKNNILYNKQFGFRSKHSTLQAILSITDKIQQAVEENQYSCGIFLDLSKAFDTVNHDLLLQKLEHYGIRGPGQKWFKSYLNNRKQFVSFGSANSNTLLIDCGVPQGSVLGPLLFLLYVNDFHNSSTKFDFHLFADDSNLFYKDKNLSYLESTVNIELSHVHSWLCANKLSLNIEKSNFVIFHPPQKKLLYVPNVSINNKPLKYETNIKYLGVILDNHLNWKAHIALICSKIKRSIGIISKARHYVNIDVLSMLYYSLVYPYLIYGIVVWGHTYESTIKPLLILQKKLIRIMTFSNFKAHTNPIFLKLKLLKLPELVYLYTGLFMYDLYSGNLPTLFTSYFTQIKHKHKYNTRLASKNSFSLPKIRTNFGKFNIRYSGAKCWNSIDESFKKLTDRNKFKERLSDDLLRSYCT